MLDDGGHLCQRTRTILNKFYSLCQWMIQVKLGWNRPYDIRGDAIWKMLPHVTLNRSQRSSFRVDIDILPSLWLIKDLWKKKIWFICLQKVSRKMSTWKRKPVWPLYRKVEGYPTIVIWTNLVGVASPIL